MKNGSSSATEPNQNGLQRPKKQSAASSSDLKVPKSGALPRKQQALHRMKVSLEKVEQCAPLTPIFGTVANAHAVIESLRFSADPVAIKFLAVHDKIPSEDRRKLWDLLIEAVAVKANLQLAEINELLGAMVRSFQSIQVQKSAMAAMAAHPGIVDKTIEFARLPRGERDRRMLHEAVRFVPTPVGSTVNVFAPHQDDKPNKPLDEGSPDVNEVFPMITDTQQDWQERRQKVLAAKN